MQFALEKSKGAPGVRKGDDSKAKDSKPISMHPREETEIAWGPGIGRAREGKTWMYGCR